MIWYVNTQMKYKCLLNLLFLIFPIRHEISRLQDVRRAWRRANSAISLLSFPLSSSLIILSKKTKSTDEPNVIINKDCKFQVNIIKSRFFTIFQRLKSVFWDMAIQSLEMPLLGIQPSPFKTIWCGYKAVLRLYLTLARLLKDYGI